MARKKSGVRRKHTPQRMCVVCRQTMDKRALTRLVRTPEGVVVDATGKQNGRGAYLCAQPACWERALTTDVLDRALRVALTDADRARLRAVQPG
jgi:predicted RNA-binding protein YlxR (DUF448 family)